ncbi:hypothetical protein SEA_SKOG_87 [Gordonia phage Skog]|uniref:Uncharacterized protein n=1 Tax=Gordonia phage Skog TaxID=2704033 RepID=A0A6G6XJE6_9CAUD|nr:hypothetical protein KHQ85_gp087 [Gordonia phage Skog]QIG58239.1 hypothetical protein SEA_SKOG_87 [Gordonia phage Skog]
MMSVHEKCPDKGTCWHGCDLACYRIRIAGPLSGVFPGDTWPEEIVAQHKALNDFERHRLREAEKRLPDADPQLPLCGSCGAETDHDGDNLYCEDCGLDFDPIHMTASYRNPDIRPCAKACTDEHPTDGRFESYTWVCGPCALPEGHKGECYTGCRLVRTEELHSS